MDFTIVTPSFRQLDWLACCIASVADQEGVSLEHIIQDAGSEGFSDFTERMRNRWPDRPYYRRVMISEPDRGMYDAINRGLQKGSGRICAYLNCDEQYLPGALAQVKRELEKNLPAEILYGGFLVMNKRGSFVTAQRPVKMFWQHVAISHLPNFSCATFFRRTMLERQGAWFDPRFRYCGDQQWTLERLRFGTPEIRIRDITSVFWDHGNNAGTGPAGLAEAASIRQAAPGLVRQLAWLWKWCHRLVKLFSGKYFPVQVRALVYAGAEARQRSMIAQGWASPVWLRRLLQQRTTLGNQPPSGPGDFAN